MDLGSAARVGYRLCSDFTRWYSVAPGKLRSCENPPKVESNMADDAQIFNIRSYIDLTFGVCVYRLRGVSDSVCCMTCRGQVGYEAATVVQTMTSLVKGPPSRHRIKVQPSGCFHFSLTYFQFCNFVYISGMDTAPDF